MVENTTILNKKNNIAIQKICAYIISALIILDSGSMYINIVNSPIHNSYFKIFIAITCIISLLFRGHFPSNGVILCAITIVVLAVYTLATHYNTGYCITYTFVFVMFAVYASGIIYDSQQEILFRAFSKTITIIAAISVFFWLFGSILNLLPKVAVQYIWGREYAYTGYSYFFLYFENPVQAAGNIIRNTGIFTEAPGYVDRLCYALGIELFYYSKHPHKIRLTILLVAMLTTLSSKAFILLLYFVGVKWIFYANVKSMWGRLTHILVVICAIITSYFLFSIVMEKEMETDSSSLTRIDHLLSGIKTWLQHPIFGVGYNNTEAIALNHMYENTPEGASMGMATSLALGGLYLFSFYVGSAFSALKKIHKTEKRRYKDAVFFIGAVMINWFISNVGYSTMTILMISMGYAYCFCSYKEQNSILI